MPLPTHAVGSLYRYTDQLLELGKLRPHGLQQALPKGPSPLRVEVWQQRLATHPDQRFATFLIQGILHGFRIGADRSVPLHPAKRNMLSALQHPSVIEDYLAKEVRLGRVLPLPWPGARVQISRFGVISKDHTPGKW